MRGTPDMVGQVPHLPSQWQPAATARVEWPGRRPLLTWSGRTCANSANSAKSLGISFAAVGARIDTRKWLMGKRAPKKYGDKVELTVEEPDSSATPQETTYRYIVVRPGDSSNERDP
jgi:hypothetical protein